MTVGVLLVNLGTPDSSYPKDVKRYLIEFLTDKRVIDLPYVFRQLLVRGVIVPKRYKNSSQLYQSIWTPQGSPLKIYGQSVALKLQQALGSEFQVELAMRYQNPSLHSALENMRTCKKILILPLFPQYASATTGSIYQEVFRILQKWEVIPTLVCLSEFATHPHMIQAFCERAKEHDLSEFDHFLFSYHGLPEKQIEKADRCNHCLKQADCCQKLTEKNHFCYAAQCVATTQALSKALDLPQEKVSHAYQSRLGKDPWLKPYMTDQIEKLAKEGKKKILVFSPAFVADCLETLQEIGMEYAREFKNAGGEKLELVRGLNDHPFWIFALKELVLEQFPKREAHVNTCQADV